MNLRRLNDNGIHRMGEFLDSLTTPEAQQWPSHVLADDRYSDSLEIEIEVEARDFDDREQVGEYLNSILDDEELSGLEKDQGLWAWLSLFYFDQLCPRDRDGNYSPKDRARWIPAFSDYRKYYRHLLYGPYIIYRAYREDLAPVRGLLCNQPSSPGEITEQLASRQELVTNRAVMEVSQFLYIDPDTGKPKRGARGSKAGSVRRLATVLGQFDLTWDLYSMDFESIRGMLPGEFDRFMT